MFSSGDAMRCWKIQMNGEAEDVDEEDEDVLNEVDEDG